MFPDMRGLKGVSWQGGRGRASECGGMDDVDRTHFVLYHVGEVVAAARRRLVARIDTCRALTAQISARRPVLVHRMTYVARAVKDAGEHVHQANARGMGRVGRAEAIAEPRHHLLQVGAGPRTVALHRVRWNCLALLHGLRHCRCSCRVCRSFTVGSF